MSARFKRKGRFKILILAALGLCAAAGSLYGFRVHQLKTRAMAARAAGFASLSTGDYLSALNHIGTYIRRFPNDADALAALAEAREHVEEPDGSHLTGAMAIFRRAIALKPDLITVRRNLADLYCRCGYFSEALATADALLIAKPGDVQALKVKGDALVSMGRIDEAYQCSVRYNDAAPLDIEGQARTLGLMLRRHAPPAEIIARAEKLSAMHPNDSGFDVLQSIAQAVVGDRQKATEWGSKGIASRVGK